MATSISANSTKMPWCVGFIDITVVSSFVIDTEIVSFQEFMIILHHDMPAVYVSVEFLQSKAH